MGKEKDYSAAIRFGSLIIVVLQSTITVLLLRYTKTRKTDKLPYLSSSVILSSECLKFISCLITLFVNAGLSIKGSSKHFKEEIFDKPRETLKLIIPSGLYLLQNNLLFLALSNLDAVTYQITYQLKILTTAIFSVCLLRKQIHSMQWLALLLLTIGVALVQLPSDTLSSLINANNGWKRVVSYSIDGKQDSSLTKSTPKVQTIDQNPTVGLVSVLLACVSSGLAGVYFELLVKTGAQTSIVIRNLQLGLFSLVFAAFAVMYNDHEKIIQNGFFQGYDVVVTFLVSIQAFGGLMVAVAVKYADNILKVFATSIAIILSSIFSYLFLHDLSGIGSQFVIGTFLVIIATIVYGWYGAKGTPSLTTKYSKSINEGQSLLPQNN